LTKYDPRKVGYTKNVINFVYANQSVQRSGSENRDKSLDDRLYRKTETKTCDTHPIKRKSWISNVVIKIKHGV
jgi:hypothetical protein